MPSAPFFFAFVSPVPSRSHGYHSKFDMGVESVLRRTDYTMREYTAPLGRIASIYVG